jgi:hypothetical protein
MFDYGSQNRSNVSSRRDIPGTMPQKLDQQRGPRKVSYFLRVADLM